MIDKDSAKHLAQTLRIVGVSQFANYGYQALQTDNVPILVLSGFLFISLELVGAFLIYKGE